MTQLHAQPMLSRYDMDSTKSFSSPLGLPRSPVAKPGRSATHRPKRLELTCPARLSSNTVHLYRRSSMTTPVVLITGALTGIGRATALAFAQEGARIVVSRRRDQEGHALTQELRARGVDAEFVRADVRHDDHGRH